MVEIWVPFTTDDQGVSGPDIPPDVDFTSSDAGARDRMTGLNPPHITSKMNVMVDESRLDEIDAHLMAKHGESSVLFTDGEEEDVAFVRMVRQVKANTSPARSQFLRSIDWETKAGAFLETLPTDTPERKAIALRLLLHACSRGMDVAQAEAFRIRKGLGGSTETTGTVDDDVLNASFIFAERHFGPSTAQEGIDNAVVMGRLAAPRAVELKDMMDARAIARFQKMTSGASRFQSLRAMVELYRNFGRMTKDHTRRLIKRMEAEANG